MSEQKIGDVTVQPGTGALVVTNTLTGAAIHNTVLVGVGRPDDSEPEHRLELVPEQQETLALDRGDWKVVVVRSPAGLEFVARLSADLQPDPDQSPIAADIITIP